MGLTIESLYGKKAEPYTRVSPEQHGPEPEQILIVTRRNPLFSQEFFPGTVGDIFTDLCLDVADTCCSLLQYRHIYKEIIHQEVIWYRAV